MEKHSFYIENCLPNCSLEPEQTANNKVLIKNAEHKTFDLNIFSSFLKCFLTQYFCYSGGLNLFFTKHWMKST